MSDARGEAAGILRTWGTDPKFSMGRNLNIWKRLVGLDGPELVNGAMSVLFHAAPELEKPVTLRIFYAASTTPLYEQCKARWLEIQHTPIDSAVPNVTLRRVPDASDGYSRDRAKKLEQYQQLTKAMENEAYANDGAHLDLD